MPALLDTMLSTNSVGSFGSRLLSIADAVDVTSDTRCHIHAIMNEPLLASIPPLGTGSGAWVSWLNDTGDVLCASAGVLLVGSLLFVVRRWRRKVATDSIVMLSALTLAVIYVGTSVWAAKTPGTVWPIAIKTTITGALWMLAGAILFFAPLRHMLETESERDERLEAEIRRRLGIEQELQRLHASLDETTSDLEFRQMALDEHAIVVTTDPRGRITHVNDRFCAISGYSREELIGQDHRMINSGYHSKQFFKEMFQTISAGKVWRGEIRNRAKGGRYYWVLTTIVPFVSSDGKVRRYTAIRDDITHLKETEAKLQDSIKQLEASQSELEQLVYTVSHDLKAPLVTILGFASNLNADLAAARECDAKDSIDRIIRAAKRLREHIDRILEFGRIGRVVRPAEPIDISEALDQVLDEFKFQLDAVGVRPTRHFQVSTVFADRDRFRQLLQNLVCNALKYGCTAPHPRIEIGSVAHIDGVRIYVRDNGPGIAPEHQERIFGLFQHLGTHPDSTGVGLAHVRRIAQVHGGDAWVQSTPGHGAEFWVSFAHARTEEPSFDTPSETARAA